MNICIFKTEMKEDNDEFICKLYIFNCSLLKKKLGWKKEVHIFRRKL